MTFIRSSLFCLGLIVSTLIAVPITLLLLAVPFAMRFRLVSNWARFNLWWMRVTCNIKAEITGLENIIDQPAIIMCKHPVRLGNPGYPTVVPAPGMDIETGIVVDPDLRLGTGNHAPHRY